MNLDKTILNKMIKKLNPDFRLLRSRKLEGGLSAHVLAIEIKESNGSFKTIVLRVHGEKDLAENSNVASDEYKVLEILEKTNIPAPQPLLLDESKEIIPQPYLVISFVQGETVLDPNNKEKFISSLAEILSKIHLTNWKKFNLSFLTKQTHNLSEKLAETPDSKSKLIQTLRSTWEHDQLNSSTLLHGDFWPGNVLWQNNLIASVIDWEDAAWGDPLADFANARYEIFLSYGDNALIKFTKKYKSLMKELDYSHLPYWDLFAVLRLAESINQWDVDKYTRENITTKTKIFTTSALKQIPIV